MKPEMMTKTSTNANFLLNIRKNAKENANSPVITPPTTDTHANNRKVGRNVEKVS